MPALEGSAVALLDFVEVPGECGFAVTFVFSSDVFVWAHACGQVDDAGTYVDCVV